MEIIALYIGMATVFGSLVGAFLSTLLSRSQKISSFRQEWINSLRNSFVDILSLSEKYTDVAYQDNEESYLRKIELSQAIFRVKLLLNLKENLSASLIGIIEKIPENKWSKSNEGPQFKEIRPEIEKLMQSILKDEWNRVRDGEWLWRLKNRKFLVALHTYYRWQGILLLMLIFILVFKLLFVL